jgi:hypothetical protein
MVATARAFGEVIPPVYPKSPAVVKSGTWREFSNPPWPFAQKKPTDLSADGFVCLVVKRRSYRVSAALSTLKHGGSPRLFIHSVFFPEYGYSSRSVE